MCKLLDNCGGSLLKRAAIIKFMVVAAMVLVTTATWAQPANDNFANATIITGANGSITGTNIAATSQPGEPIVDGVGGGHTVWYQWTSPLDGNIIFNTEGSTFDTVLGVFTGSSVNALTAVAANDDVNFPADATSRVTFAVTSGTVYYVAVDGFSTNTGGITLNWLPQGSLSAGQFQFASSTTFGNNTPGYIISESDSSPPITEVHMTLTTARVRVTRTLGSSGRVQVGYTITNGFYTNTLVTNIYGTNIFATNIGQGTFTNVLLTNYLITNFLQDNVYGVYRICTNPIGRTFIVSNDDSGLLTTNITLTTNVLSVPLVCSNKTFIGYATNATGPFPIVTQFTTNTFCTNFSTNVVVAAARPGVDYTPTSGVLDFFDYQMGTNIYVQVNRNNSTMNRMLVVKLTSVALDPLESTTLTPPTLSSASNALVNVLSLNATHDDPCSTTNIIYNFSQTRWRCLENVKGLGFATIFVQRTGNDPTASGSVSYDVDYLPNQGTNRNDTFPLEPGSDYATPDVIPPSFPPSSQTPDFQSVSGTLSWGANDFNFKAITIPIVNDSLVEFNEDIRIRLFNPSTGQVGLVSNATLTVLFNDQPAGAIDRDYNPNNSLGTVPPNNSAPGANRPVNAIAMQTDGRAVIAGDFTAYNTAPRNHIARVNTDGSLDTAFLASNSGINSSDSTLDCVALDSTGKILIGGFFTAFNGISRYSVARLNTDGSLDTSFNPGVGVTASNGAAGTVWSLAIQPDGKILIAGNFSQVNATNRSNIARLNTDGSLDTTFNPGVGPNDTINAVALQSDGKMVIGGQFTTVGSVARQSVARLNADGTLDTTFNPGAGTEPNTYVYALAEQPDGRVLVGGSFTTFNLNSRNSITRLNSDGSVDASFNPGSGANDVVYSMHLQPDGTIFIGGLFTSYNQTRRMGLARLFTSGALDTSFLDTAYNQFAGTANHYFSTDVEPRNFVYAFGLQTDGSVIIGGGFNQMGGGYQQDRGAGEQIPVRDGFTPRQNFARLIGNSTPGPGNIGLTYTNYTADENGGKSYVTLTRANGHLGPAGVTVTATDPPAGSGAAVSGRDYTFDPASANPVFVSSYGSTWMQSDGIFGPNNNTSSDVPNLFIISPTDDVYVNILDNNILDGNRVLNLTLSNPTSADIFFLGGENIPAGTALDTQTSAPLEIVDNESAHGTVSFSSPNYTVDENATNAVITVIRTNGTSGTLNFTALTIPGGTAVAGTTNDYISVSKPLTFNNPNVTTISFNVPIVNNSVARANDRTVMLALTNITGGGTIGLGLATLTIINDNVPSGHLNFSVTNFGANETDGQAIVTVTRAGGSLGSIDVSVASSNGTAINGLNFSASTNILHWNNGEVAVKTFLVPVFHDGLVTSNLTVNLSLLNPVVNGVTNFASLGGTSNAVLTITNDDFFGNPTFSAATYNVNENAGFVMVTVNRVGGSAQTITVDYATSDGSAFQNVNYTPTSGTLTFKPGQFSQSFQVPVIDDNPPLKNGNQTFNVTLSNPTPSSGPGGGVTLGIVSNAAVTIIDNETFVQPAGGIDTVYAGNASFNGTVYCLALQADGKLLAGGDFTLADNTFRNRIARLNTDGTLDGKFSSSSGGADGSVRTVVFQQDGGVLIGGQFANVNSVNRAGIARLNSYGGLDQGFDPGSGADNPVYAMAETFVMSGTNLVRRIVVGGSFAHINGVGRVSIAQLNNDGSVDTTFNPSGANGTVYAVAVYSTNGDNGGKILIGGDFTSVNGVNRQHIARLNVDGTLDTTFNPGVGPNNSVRAIAIQLDGGVVIGGVFTTVGNTGLNHIARLNSNGLLDPSFSPGVGANDVVSAIALQEDNKIIVGGSFTQASGVSRNRITRLNQDGSLDPTINFGTGADNFITSVLVQSDDKILVGGGFTNFESHPSPYIARLYGLTTPGPGSLTFITTNYVANDNGTNIVITVRRDGGTGDTNIGNVYVNFATSNATAISGIDYIGVTNTLTFAVGETIQTITIPILTNTSVQPSVYANLTLYPPLSPTNFDAALGVQPTSRLTISNVNSSVAFSSPTYTVVKNVGSGTAVITVQRNNSAFGPASVDFYTTNTGSASPTVDYVPTSGTILFADGQTSQTIAVPVVNNGLVEGSLTVGLVLGNPTNTIITSPATATLTILDNSNAKGNFIFSASGYTVSELGTNITITVIRTNGVNNSVSVGYSTGGGTAVAGVDYVPTNGNLSFGDGITNASFTVNVLHNPLVTGDLTVGLTLTNPSVGTQVLPPATVPLTIVDMDVGVNFDLSAYFIDETNGTVTIGVNRLSNTNSTVSVQFATTNGNAIAGSNYIATSGTLTFGPGETFKTFSVGIIRNTAITGNLSFFVTLFNPSSLVQLVNPSTTTVVILDDDIGLSFASSTNSVVESATNTFVTVLRTGSPVGPVSVHFATSDGTATNGIRYFGTNGVVTLADGQTSTNILIPIIDDKLVEGDQSFNIALSSPSGVAHLLTPSNEVITVIDDDSSVSFSSPSYSVAENGIAASITVIRSGVSNGTVTVNYATGTNGTAVPGVGGQYFPTNGVLVFTNGQTSTNFVVTLIDANITGGSETVSLVLSNATGPVTLANPTNATLTIFNNDGSLVVPAGSALLTETGAGTPNNVIDPNETVTLLLALRNSAGTNTTANFTATLLATNGVTLPSPSSPVNYGILVTNGASVSRQFQFKAVGTNGTQIAATLQMQDGSKNLGFAIFNYTLGQTTTTYSNTNYITINDHAAATPYPASILVSSLSGVISKVTATVTNLGHGNISDVSMLLTGPGGQKDLLMAKAGGIHTITNVTLTFDDTAGAYLTTNAPVSGTNKPTAFSTSIPFPAQAPSGPYGTNFSDFIGGTPSGTWSLYVYDDKNVDVGSINNGWSLSISSLNIVAPTVNLMLGMTGSANPSVVGSNLTYSITITNSGPGGATNIVLTDNLPSGVSIVSDNASQGAWGIATSNVLVWNVGSLSNGASASANVVIAPPVIGSITNTVTVGSAQIEANTNDNTASIVTVISGASADLAMGVVDSPDPIFVGNNLTYTVTVTNFGPATATNVIVTNTLPPGVTFVSLTPSGIGTNVSGIITYPLGSIGSGSVAGFTILVKPTLAGNITNNAVVGSAVTDPFKSNNQVATKTEVDFVQLNVVHSGSNLTFSWPTSASGYTLQVSTTLNPAVWTTVPGAPSVSGGQYVITVPFSGGPQFFRLKGP